MGYLGRGYSSAPRVFWVVHGENSGYGSVCGSSFSKLGEIVNQSLGSRRRKEVKKLFASLVWVLVLGTVVLAGKYPTKAGNYLLSGGVVYFVTEHDTRSKVEIAGEVLLFDGFSGGIAFRKSGDEYSLAAGPTVTCYVFQTKTESGFILPFLSVGYLFYPELNLDVNSYFLGVGFTCFSPGNYPLGFTVSGYRDWTKVSVDESTLVSGVFGFSFKVSLVLK